MVFPPYDAHERAGRKREESKRRVEDMSRKDVIIEGERSDEVCLFGLPWAAVVRIPFPTPQTV